MDAVVSLISSVGFPILACIVMAYYVKYTTDASRAEVTQLQERHQEEMASITEALNNNTKALERLSFMMENQKTISKADG